VRNVKVKDQSIEMTVRTTSTIDYGTGGIIVRGWGGVGSHAAYLEVNLKFSVSKEIIRSADIFQIDKAVQALIAWQKPRVDIKIGMSAKEVMDQAGQPSEEMTIEGKRVLVYPHFTVILQDEKVVEVKIK